MATHTPNPRSDLAAFVAHEQATGQAEQDPYGYAMAVIGTTLAFALSDGISGAMSQGEHNILSQMAAVIIASGDPASYNQFVKQG